MSVYRKIINSKKKSKPSVIALIDPDKKNEDIFYRQIEYVKNNDFSAVLIGGSLIMDSKYRDRVRLIKKSISLPVIAFPSSASQVDGSFDAILFLSLISGRNPQYLIGEQVISAPIIHSLGLEAIPVGYILLDGGEKTSVEIVSNTRSLPMKNYDIVISHALASQYLGHKFIYLECGSNSLKIIDLKLLSKIKEVVDIPVIVGGGVKDETDISDIYNAGADFIVASTMIENKARIA